MARRTVKSDQQIIFDPAKFENPLQVGGIRTGTLDYPDNGVGSSPGQACRAAFFNTGTPLRFTVAIDRGGDLVEASYAQHSLAYLTPNGYVPPSHAFNRNIDWLYSWPGGLLTTCGPEYAGKPRIEGASEVPLHGRYSNFPAAVTQLINPDPQRGQLDMVLQLVTRDSRMFGPVIEVRREIRCRLGQAAIELRDEVINRGNTSCGHNYLYHINLGYPLIDEGTRLIYRGKPEFYWESPNVPDAMPPASVLNKIKRVPGVLAEHAGGNERGVIVRPTAGRDGRVRIGAINAKLGLALEISYPLDQLTRLVNFQHFGPGSYLTGLEPLWGTLRGRDEDPCPEADFTLAPGESRVYLLSIRVLSSKAEMDELAAQDGPLSA